MWILLISKQIIMINNYIPVAKVKEDGKGNLYSTASNNGKQFNYHIPQTTQPILITEMRKYVENYHSDSDFKFHAQFEVNEIC